MRNYFALLLVVTACHASPQTGRNYNWNTFQLYTTPAHGHAQSPNQQRSSPEEATVLIQGTVSGFLQLLQPNAPDGETVITGTIQGLTPGLHGFHIHQTGNLSQGCQSTGGHYNPSQSDHGAPQSRDRHVGDLGNIWADQSGTAIVNIRDHLVTLVGPNSVIGRAIVVHAGEDDLGQGGDHGSRTTGNAGGRVGCGVIGRA